MNLVKNVNIDLITANPYQPRINFSTEGIDDLATSIKENGLLQPISVREVDGKYQIIAGERRLKALKKLNVKSVDVLVLEKSDIESAQLALLENVIREDLSAIEEAKAYINILRMHNLTQEELADRIGKSQAGIANKIRLLNLNEDVQNAIIEKKITERHGRSMLSLSDNDQKEVLKTILKKNMNVTETEKYINSHYTNKKEKQKIRCYSSTTKLCIDTLKHTYEDMNKLGLNVKMNQKETENEVIVSFVIKK